MNGCFINRNATIVSMSSILIEEGVTIGPNVCIYDHDHNHSKVRQNEQSPFVSAPITIEQGAWIGANVVVLKGVTIGKGAVVAAGAVVNKNVPPSTMVGGVPAKVICSV